jgi:hypothetical protein
MMKRLFFLAMVFLWVPGGVTPELGAVEKTLTRVKVMVQADEDSQTAVENLLRKELRALGDIALVEEKPEFEIRVIVMGSAAKGKEDAGVAFSTVFLAPFFRSGIPELYGSRERGEMNKPEVNGTLSKTQIYKDHLLQVGSGRDVEQICRDIARNFKVHILGIPRLTPQNR